MPRLIHSIRSRFAAPRAVDSNRREASYPPPYPNGWYALARSADVGATPLHVLALGKELVLFRRASDGRVGALDAHCPHLGANLALGSVQGDCIECPFHRWRFDVEGRVAGIPYANRVPRSLGTPAHAVEELHGLVCVYHGHGEAPSYRPARVPEIDSGELVFRGEQDGGIVRMHLVEFAENSADLRHFDVLHSDMLVPFTSLKVPGVRVRHRVGWRLDPAEPHVVWFDDEANVEILGKRPNGSGATATIRLEGPGGIARFDFDVRRLGRLVLYQTHVPIEPLAQRVRFRWFAAKTLPRPLVSYVVGSWIAQWRQDIAIWESKVYRHRPALVKEDGPVHALRRWYAQFYPEGAPASAPRGDDHGTNEDERAQASARPRRRPRRRRAL